MQDFTDTEMLDARRNLVSTTLSCFLPKGKQVNQSIFYNVVKSLWCNRIVVGTTYHAPGQQVMYVLIDIKRHKNLNVRQLVTAPEQTVVKTLAEYGIESYPKPDAPGVYVDGKKICSLGLRIRRGCSFHGLALNINMDLNPFHYINPCGYAGLEMCPVSGFC